MSWIIAALLLAPAAGDCAQPVIGKDQAQTMFPSTIERRSRNPERYLDQGVETTFRCIDGKGRWFVTGRGPSGSFDDMELISIDAASGTTEHMTAPCAAQLKLNYDSASEIARRYATAMKVRWGDYHQPFLRSHCEAARPPYWLFSAMNRSLAPDSMLLIRINDESGIAALVSQG